MVDKPAHPSTLEPATLAELACPACYGDLRLELHVESAHVLCVACGRAYPLVDGIPVLIIERATQPR